VRVPEVMNMCVPVMVNHGVVARRCELWCGVRESARGRERVRSERVLRVRPVGKRVSVSQVIATPAAYSDATGCESER
jgi:hypothetical protein